MHWYRLDFGLKRLQLSINQNELSEKYAHRVEVYPELKFDSQS